MRNALIMGAAGRDFHNFNVYFRHRNDIRVKAFTATQIPNITDRKYPPELAGKFYPHGIPIYPESDLPKLVKELDIEAVYFSYSDVAHEYVMHKASEVLKEGANFILLGPKDTMISSTKPVLSVCAVRTGCGKSSVTQKISEILKIMGYRVAVVRHPMPYGDLIQQKVQKFISLEDLTQQKCTIEEMEEYEPYIVNGTPLFSGVDYGEILKEAEKIADIILWDGGNNDFSFYKAGLEIVVVDPHRAGHEIKYHPGETNFKRADVIIINKIDTADWDKILEVRKNINRFNAKATVIDAVSPLSITDSYLVKDKRVLVIEDGPTLTHGGMQYGAGIIAAYNYGAAEIVDPRPYVSGSIKEFLEKYPHVDKVLPTVGYGSQQVKELERAINKAKADTVIMATPGDLERIMIINKPTVRVTYNFQEISTPTLTDVLQKWIKSQHVATSDNKSAIVGTAKATSY